jgi:hypothetical protein
VYHNGRKVKDRVGWNGKSDKTLRSSYFLSFKSIKGGYKLFSLFRKFSISISSVPLTSKRNPQRTPFLVNNNINSKAVKK